MTVAPVASIMRTFVSCASSLLIAAAALCLAGCSPAGAPPRTAPQAGYTLHDEQMLGPFVVQRWVNAESSEVSPAGMCDCITVVYAGERQVVSLGTPGEISAIGVSDLSGRDINNDGSPEVIVTEWSGGAHCCYSTSIYSVDAAVRTLLSLATGNCGAEFEDLDGNGTLELVTCDDSWAYQYCSFADSPMPRVVLAYDAERDTYAPATPRYAGYLAGALATSLDEAERWMAASGGDDRGVDKCRLLQPALAMMYTGRLEDGIALLRRLYDGPDLDGFVRETREQVMNSRFWRPI